MNKITTKEELAERVSALPSVQNEAFAEIIKGLYQGRPLLGKDGLLTNLVRDLTKVALQGEMAAHLSETALEEGGNRP